MKVAVQDERELQIAASAVDSCSEVQFLGAEFEHMDKDALKSRAIAEACENAEKRRKIFEEKLGFRLVPSRFSGGSVSQRAPAMLGNYQSPSYDTKRSPAHISTLSAGLPASAGDVTALREDVSSFGELIYTAEVMIEYEVKAK